LAVFDSGMKKIAQALLFDPAARLLIYLRDDKADIPFPNHWDFFGGHVEPSESPEQALVREVKEELGVELRQWRFFRRYQCLHGDAYPNLKYIYYGRIDRSAVDLSLLEGQRLAAIHREERFAFRFANVLGAILEDFVAAGLWPVVDKSPR
jgi:8-oxo-dGTP diphosphatase